MKLTNADRLVRAAVFQRDGRCMIAGLPNAGPCGGWATPHHRRKASQGGGYTLDNLVSACSVHNDALESDADLAAAARAAGLVLRRGDDDWEACA